MSIPAVDTTKDEQTTEGAAADIQPGAGEVTQDPAPGAEEGAEDKGEAGETDDEPIEARLERRERELRNVRDEAAKRRTQVKDLEAKLAEAKTPDDIEAAVAEFRTKAETLEKELRVIKLAAANSLDENLTKVLSGFPVDQLEEQAKLLAAYAPKKREGASLDDLSGGLTPGGGSVRDGGSLSPVEAAKAMRRRRR